MSDSEKQNPTSLWRSFQYAGHGFAWLIRNERNFRLHLVAAGISVLLAVILDFSLLEWGVLLLTISVVMVSEALNASIEQLLDHIHPEQHPSIGRAKDIAAGGVLIASIISVMIGVLLFGPRLWELLFSSRTG